MFKKLTFEEYMESKKKLRSAGDDCLKYITNYEINKYCKLPLLENIDDTNKVYVTLRPKDRIKIFWEAIDLVHPIPKYISVISEDFNENKYYFSWNLDKITNWLSATTYKK